MLNVILHIDSDNKKVQYFDTVDGQQRLRTLFEYKDGQTWGAKSSTKSDPAGDQLLAYGKLSPAAQDNFDDYKVAVALMRDYEIDEILDVYNRLQHSKPLRIGEKVKALRTDFKSHLRELVEHKIFKVASGRHRIRDSHWNLAAIFFRSVYRNNPLERQEYDKLEEFLRSEKLDPDKANKALADTRRFLNFENKIIEEALEQDPKFIDAVASARLLKWLFVSLMLLIPKYAINGREHLVAKAVLAYWKAKETEGADEWGAYLNTGRTGRIDTNEVRASLEQLMNRIILEADANPIDPKRFFTPEQRREIFAKSNGKCAKCQISLSYTNFHADHIIPYTGAGKTQIENGQALCTKCNREKGGSHQLFEVATS